jgi:hypothetical protein
MFYFWRRIGEEDRLHVWRLYGWFSALILCGSCFGAITWGFWMQREVDYFSSVSSNLSTSVASESALLYFYKSKSERLSSVYVVNHAIEFFCLSVAQLLVLDRMSDFAFPPRPGLAKGLRFGQWAVLAVVMTGNAVSFCSSVAASVYYSQSGEFYNAASVASSENEIESHVDLARRKDQIAYSTSSIQMFCETIVVIIILLSVAVVGAACAHRITSTLVITDVNQSVFAAGRRLHLKIVCTSVFVFLAFLFRSAYATMFAVVSQLQNSGKVCRIPISPTFYCSDCFNGYTHLWEWMLNSPELLMAVYTISSPLALLVSLWGMTSVRMMQLIISLKGGTQESDSIL